LQVARLRRDPPGAAFVTPSTTLSGRHLCVSDNLEALLARIDEIERDDLHTLRLRAGV
jgi:hypothetical protein